MDWVTIAADAAQAIADVQMLLALGKEIEPEIKTAILLLTQRTTLTDAQRAQDLTSLNAMQAELDLDAGGTE